MRIHISLARQILTLLDERDIPLCRYPVSTAANGPGEQSGSYCTPRGKHIIRARIGSGAPVNTVFVRRRPTGEIYTPELGNAFPERDWILTRILWLRGCEWGFNRDLKRDCGTQRTVDTMRRYIYIHGSPDDIVVGQAGSHGCIRMKNSDLIELFECVSVGTVVEIDNADDFRGCLE
ncbi:MAG: L,D-transpeptidase [Betaproteobacteria bacterium]|nr:L,D-transpeptidase [Betaproteobacteria bacterium]